MAPPSLLDRARNFLGIGGPEKVPVIDTKGKSPTAANIPRKWNQVLLGPGQPLATGLFTSGAREQDQETEPRSFVYVTNVNATMSPRVAYGLTPFADLRAYAEGVPEVGQSIRILTEELKAFRPVIQRPDSSEISPADREWLNLRWMVERPDRYNPWPVWLSRFLYNVLVYDAGALYRERAEHTHAVIGLRVIDGSTLFALVDEQGEQPRPPAPAFQQIIYGMPRGLYNAHQIWYRPRHLRPDAPYGRSPIEDALPAVRVLANIWDYEGKWYTEGSTPEQMLTSPENWSADQILEFESAFNARMGGNAEERAGRIRFMPAGTTSLSLKDARFREDVYGAASNVLRMAYGIPKTEAGESPGTGLGGSGFLEAMQSMFYRMGLAPLKAYVESVFNETLAENGYYGYTFALTFPRESLDPKKEEEKTLGQWEKGIITRNEARRAIGMDEIDGPQGEEFTGGQGAMQDPNGMGMDQAGRFGNLDTGEEGLEGGPTIPVTSRIPVTDKIPVTGGKIPVSNKIPVAGKKIPVEQKIQVSKLAKGAGVSPTDDAHFGSPITVRAGIAYLGKDGLPAAWMPGHDACDEGVYLIDRALAPNDQSYLVPVTYHASAGGIDGLVTWPAAGRRGQRVSRYTPAFLDQAAAVDYIAGVVRQADDYITHPEEPSRPVLLATGLSFADEPQSPFVKARAGTILSADVLSGVEAMLRDEALWADLATCAGKEAAQAAKERAQTLLDGGMVPARAGTTETE